MYTKKRGVWNDRNRLVKSMATILPQSFSRGLNVNKLGDMLAKELNVSQNRGRTLARTEINNICNQADLAVYKAAGIKKYQFVATLDLRTSGNPSKKQAQTVGTCLRHISILWKIPGHRLCIVAES